MINKVKEFVKEQCEKDTNFFGMNAYTHHFISTVKYAKLLAKETRADEEIVEIAAWLHDIGSIMGEYENHHISSLKYAEKLLLELNYPKEKIEKVKHCIVAHRASKDIPRETIEAECVANADAMSHFDNLSSLFYLAIKIRKLDTDKAKEFVKGKLERSWNKLTPNAKTIIKNKYEAVLNILG